MAGGEFASEFGDGRQKPREKKTRSRLPPLYHTDAERKPEKARGFARGGSKARVTPTRPNPTRTRGSSVEPRTEAFVSAPMKTTQTYYFRVDGVLRVCTSRNGFPNCFDETEESSLLSRENEVASSSAGRPAESTLVVLYALSSVCMSLLDAVVGAGGESVVRVVALERERAAFRRIAKEYRYETIARRADMYPAEAILYARARADPRTDRLVASRRTERGTRNATC